MRAIDLYSGIGGWALGFRNAGIEIVSSYEWWESAAITEEKNLETKVNHQDIRQLDLSTLPTKIDIVVGSPPCTQFSYANRGGSGDLDDGLQDIAKFLEVVEHLKPKFWAMENVPRLASILECELSDDGKLAQFAYFREGMFIEVFDMSEFGLPQRRKRCIAGHFPIELLKSYKERCNLTTLGEVISGLEKPKVTDVNYGTSVNQKDVLDHIKEPFFDFEEERINREAKTHHPVYNDMSFPDPWNRPVRTVTATCTRVSRESIVIEDVAQPDCFRRLTVRERGLLQGFPMTYQFFGRSYPEKQKMIGNAIPPVFTYYIANAMQKTPTRELTPLPKLGHTHPLPKDTPAFTPPDQIGRLYPDKRRFWFAIQNLRFKSGMRFDLVNKFQVNRTDWTVEFYYGPSKDIRSIELDQDLLDRIRSLNWLGNVWSDLERELATFQMNVEATDLGAMQSTWTDKSIAGPHPFLLLELLGDTAASLIKLLPKEYEEEAAIFVTRTAAENSPNKEPVSANKLQKYGSQVFCGLLLASSFNSRNSQVQAV